LDSLPLASAGAWFAVAVGPAVRFRLGSPLERSFALFAFLLGVWAGLDWAFLSLGDPSQADLAVTLSNARVSVAMVAALALLLAAKWLYLGHAPWDALLALPVAAGLVVPWTGLVSGIAFTASGPQVFRDPVRYAICAGEEIAYFGAAAVFLVAVYFRRKAMPRRLRWRGLAVGASFLLSLWIWLSTNVYGYFAQDASVRWLSSFLVVPALVVLAAFAPLSEEDLGALFRALSAVEERVIAVYLYYADGQPVVALTSSKSFDIEAEQAERMIGIARDFMNDGLRTGQSFKATTLRSGDKGLVAVSSQHVTAAALCASTVYDAILSELLHFVREFERGHAASLGTWEQATRVADSAARGLSPLLYRPTLGIEDAPSASMANREG
jgi:hypothetical protein